MNEQHPVILQSPLAGEWRYLRPPGHHRYAIDLVQYDSQRRHSCRGGQGWRHLIRVSSTAYYCWEQPVYAPIGGTVVRAADDWPDHLSTSLWSSVKIWYSASFRFKPRMAGGRLDIRPNAGNHVMIRSAQGPVVFMAHLRNGSLCIGEGDEVHAGDRIANVGNSGNSTAPHLHINVFDQVDDPYRSELLEFVFERYDRLDGGQWNRIDRSAPSAGDFIRFPDPDGQP